MQQNNAVKDHFHEYGLRERASTVAEPAIHTHAARSRAKVTRVTSAPALLFGSGNYAKSNQ
jgi:hypothetical protein